jgi:signal transduction histidine kinase
MNDIKTGREIRQPAENREILIVEDSQTQALKLAHVLRSAGYPVALAENGEAALAYLEQHRPALIISDILMPKMDGYEMCRRIKAQPATRAIPVLLLTSLSDANDVLRGMKVGADSFASKPYHEAKLLARVQNMLLNQERWKNAALEAGNKVFFAGQEHQFSAGAGKILEFLLYTYEDAVERNRDLIKARDELTRANQELKEKTDALAVLNRELESFSYSVAHDLRAPLTRITGFSQVLITDHADELSGDALNCVRRVVASCENMEHLIEDLLMLSRISRAEMNRAPVNLSEMARTVADDLQRDAPQRRIEFVIAPGVSAQADARLMKIVLANLLGNAWKFTGKQPDAMIEFGLTAEDGRRVYYVRDNGAGFEMKDADRLFGAFQRLHSQDEFPGAGIGLATVQRIIHRHGGQIWAEGKTGEGARFSFTLG